MRVKKLCVFSEDLWQDLMKSSQCVMIPSTAEVAAFTKLLQGQHLFQPANESAQQTPWCHWGCGGWDPLNRLSIIVHRSHFQVLNFMAFHGAVRGYDYPDVFIQYVFCLVLQNWRGILYFLAVFWGGLVFLFVWFLKCTEYKRGAVGSDRNMIYSLVHMLV